MTTLLLLLGLLAAILLSALSSGSETGVYSLDRVQLRVEAQKGSPAARRLERLMERPEDLVIATLVGTNVADYVATACIAGLLLRAAVGAQLTELYATAIATPLILVFGGIIPKDWFRRESNRLLAWLSGLLWLGLGLVRVTGVAWLLRLLTRAVIHRIDPTRRELEAALLPRARTLRLVREGAAQGRLTRFQRDLIERVLNLSSVRVNAVMIRRQRMAAVPRTICREDFLRVARMAHFSRLPVWEQDPRHVVGVVNVYDVITDREARPVAEYVRSPLLLPEQTAVPEALLKMQRSREAMAIVVDRAGQCVGILTLKDLVEEIVGDLEVW